MPRRSQRKNARPTLAVWKFASCDGCQLSILDCEDELLALVGAVEIAYFLEATRHTQKGPYDISLVEGSITTPDDAVRIQKIRKQSKVLVSIGACATSGGIQALKNGRDVDEFIETVYAYPEFIDTLAVSSPISNYVTVDYELFGCPVNKKQLVEILAAYLLGRKPQIENASVCTECKRHGTVCVLVSQGTACLGPVTHAGCNALCPSFNRGCFGCYGPKAGANPEALSEWVLAQGVSRPELVRLYSNFNARSPVFDREVNRLEQQDH